MAGIDNTTLFSSGEKLTPSSANDILRMKADSTDIARINHTGNPEGVIDANPGSLCHDPVSGAIYYKQSGTSNTGWNLLSYVEGTFLKVANNLDDVANGPTSLANIGGLPIAGGTMTGDLFLNADPTTSTQAATKSYVDSKVDTGLPIGALAYYPNANGDSYLTGGVWLKCNGQVLSQATYSTLYSRIGFINPPGTNWTARTFGATATINSITYGTGIFVATGSTGIIKSSTDGITWTNRSSIASQTINGINFGGGIFTYVGNAGILATSTDGANWQTKSPSIGENNFPYTMLWDGSKYLSCTVNGSIASSTDAVTWTSVTSQTTGDVTALLLNAGLYVYGSNGTIATSTDGISWTQRASGLNQITGIAFGNSTYVATAKANASYSSTDAITWTTRTMSALGNAVSAPRFSSSLGLFACGFNGNNNIFTSTDGITWTSRTANSPNAIAFGASVFAAGGGSGTIRSSTDGITWTTRTSNTASTIQALIFENSLFVYGTAGGGIGTSTDGITWSARTSGTTSSITSIIFNTVWYAGTQSGLITSTDAITWTTMTGYSGTSSNILTVGFGNSTLVYAGVSGLLATSTDGHTWASQSSGTSSNINTITYGTKFAFGGAGGVLSTSTDAVSWSAETSGTTSSIQSLIYSGLYLFSGLGGVISSSTDAVTWVSRTSGTTSNLNALVFANTFYNACGAGGVVLESPDAITWYARTSSTTSALNAAISGSTLLVEGGVNGALQTSLNDYPFDKNTQFQLPNDNQLQITTETTTNFLRSLYIKVLE